MDRQTAEHFYKWLESTVDIRDQHQVEQDIHALLKQDPELINDHSWPEMRDTAEGMGE